MRTLTLTRMVTLAAALCLTAVGSFAAASSASAAVPGTAYQQIRNAVYSQCVDAPGGALNVHVKLENCSSAQPTRNWLLVPTGAAR